MAAMDQGLGEGIRLGAKEYSGDGTQIGEEANQQVEEVRAVGRP